MTGNYEAEPVILDDILSDVRIRIKGKVWHLWGREGRKRETDLAAAVPGTRSPCSSAPAWATA